MLAGNDTLQSLCLSHNSLMNDAHDLEGFVALCRALAQNTGLLSLDLSWNRLTGTSYCTNMDGVGVLVACLRENTNLATLSFENNYLDLDGELMLQRACASRNIEVHVKNRSELG